MTRKSTFSGHEGVPPPLIKDSACINLNLVGVETARDSRKDGVSMSAPSDQGH
jgi:hypothetical protein